MERTTAYITTSIPYVNGPPHIGHALEFVQADAFARYRRQLGHPTRLQSGTDDNSLNNVLAAERAGLPVGELVERNTRGFRALLDRLQIGYDGFLRTSVDPEHRAGVTALWQACAAAGAIYRRPYRGLYCVGCECFYAESELTPEGYCPEHGTRPELVEEDNYFFRLSRYADTLQELINSGTLRIVPEGRRNEVLAFIAAGLTDFSISRSQMRAHGWGIPVPGDPGQVMYVWFDALGNYVTALGYDGREADHPLLRAFWTEAGERLHVIGKGIVRFHAIYWPAMLLAAGLPLPTTIFVHGYLTSDGQKIGKSLGNAIDPQAIIARCGVDALRWYLLREVPPTADADFSVARLVARHNADLAHDLGNLLHRLNSMLHRYRGGLVPAANQAGLPAAAELAAIAAGLPDAVAAAMDACDPRPALAAIWALVVRANRAVDETRPWTLARAEATGDRGAAQALDALLYALLESVRLVAVHLEPFVPDAAARIQAALGVADAGQPYPRRVRWGGLREGSHTAPPAVLFPLLE